MLSYRSVSFPKPARFRKAIFVVHPATERLLKDEIFLLHLNKLFYILILSVVVSMIDDPVSNTFSSILKYKPIVKAIMGAVNRQNLIQWYLISSSNESSIHFSVPRDNFVKAYKEFKSLRMIFSFLSTFYSISNTSDVIVSCTRHLNLPHNKNLKGA